MPPPQGQNSSSLPPVETLKIHSTATNSAREYPDSGVGCILAYHRVYSGYEIQRQRSNAMTRTRLKDRFLPDYTQNEEILNTVSHIVGGGFGVGIHNVPEAAVYGIPVIIGPNNKKFREAQALLKNGGCREIHNATDFQKIMDQFTTEPDELKQAGERAGQYIHNNAGAADKIFQAVMQE